MAAPDTLADPGVTAAPAVSIVMAVLNQLDYTRQCVDSIRRHTQLPHEVIVVDNGSTDGSAAAVAALGCRVIRNEENLGCARAWNQGIRAARAPLIVIMNNDIVVTPGWLDALVEVRRRSGCAVVSPAIINGVLDYDLAALAAAHRERLGRRWRRGWGAACFLTSRQVFDRIGLFDEQFRQGGFEDDDFDMRLRRAHLTARITGAALIHHFGQITQRALAGERWKRTKNPNKTLLERKWGWRLLARRGRKELRKLVNRIRFPGWHGRSPRDVLVVAEDEQLDLRRSRKVRRNSHRPQD